jgi:hypothetical protein
MKAWFNYEAVLQIIIAGLIVGAGLPALFSLGVRLNAEGAGVAGHGGAVAQKNQLLVALSWVIFAVVLAVVIAGVLFIARDFIGHHTGLYLFGAKPK